MEKKGEEAAAKFINALIKSLQTLCHGYLDFQSGIEIMGHINLSVDKGSSLDYILKEKVCRNAENSTLFISNSFHAEAKPEELAQRKQFLSDSSQCAESGASMDQGEGGKLASAIASITSSLSGPREKHRRSSDARDFHLSYTQHKGSSRRRSSQDQTSELHPAKVPHISSECGHSRQGSSPGRSRGSLQGLAASDGSTSETLLPQTASVGDNSAIGVNLAGSVLEPVGTQNDSDLNQRDDDSDGDLEVTFIKEEYGQGDNSPGFDHSSGHQFTGAQRDGSRFPGGLHDSSASFMAGSFEHGPQFSSGDCGASTSQPGPSGLRDPFWRVASTPQCQTPSVHSSTEPSSSPCTSRWPRNALPEHPISTPDAEDVKPFHLQAMESHDYLLPEGCGDAAGGGPSASTGAVTGYSERCLSQAQQSRICPICGKWFDRREYFQDHMNMHNKVKAHKCSNCASAFTYKRNLWQHVRDGVCFRNKRF